MVVSAALTSVRRFINPRYKVEGAGIRIIDELKEASG